MSITQGMPLYTPSEETLASCVMARYMSWLERETGQRFASYDALWRWSVTDLEGFWDSIRRFFAVGMSEPRSGVLTDRRMPGARWFPGTALNYAASALRVFGSGPALIARREDGTRTELSWDALHDAVARARAGLARLGVGLGDRVAAYLPNGPEAVIAFLATASLGALWSSCSPEFGVQSVLDRLSQIEPKVLISVDGYTYGGKGFERLTATASIAAALPSLVATVIVPRLDLESEHVGMAWSALLADAAPLTFEPCPFEHPLWILYSSGTTGLPKPIVQGHGGILLEHLKALALHCDLGPDSRFFWFTTTGWMMWNFLVSGLCVGATIVLYEGNPAHPDLWTLFRLAAEERVTYFGTSAPFLISCEKSGLRVRDRLDLSALRAVGSTGAPLPVSGFAWVYEQLKPDVHLGSVSGGTDVCTGLLLSCPLLPVHAGELQCRALGAKVEAFDEAGHAQIGRVGELVVTEPMPSMPLYFLHDEGGARLSASYFERFPGIWHHGDFLEITERGSAIIYGRSDATLNRGGIRVGTSEVYRIVESLPEIQDSLIVDTSALDREGELWLFVVLADGVRLDARLERAIGASLRSGLSPRHVPDHVVSIPEVPRTLNGKKLEVPIKRILMGSARGQVIQPGTLQNLQAVDALMAAVRAIAPTEVRE